VNTVLTKFKVNYILLLLTVPVSLFAVEESLNTQVLKALSKSADFMMEMLSCNGGFLWKYSEDFEEVYGEIKAEKSMIWFESPGTPTVGMMFLQAYEVTHDIKYLQYAKIVADAIIKGQLPCGGWHYFTDFENSDLQQYYNSYLSTIWGWQEFLYFYGNATFDDQVTADCTRMLMRLYCITRENKYLKPLKKSLNFILEAQYPNGAWPQRYPLMNDYTAWYTFNDGVIENNIKVLIEAYNLLGENKYLNAARRGMDFYKISQLSTPQAGWAQQYDYEMKPAWGRTFEINTICSGVTIENIEALLKFYKITGDRSYLNPIPDALSWLNSAVLDTINGKHTFTYFYEMGSSKPLYMHRKGDSKENFHFVLSYDHEGAYPYGVKYHFDLDELKNEYYRVKALSPNAAHKEYESLKDDFKKFPVINRITNQVDYRVVANDIEEIHELIESLNNGNGWVIEDIIFDTDDFLINPPKYFRGYDTGTYVTRMYRLINYLR